MTLVSAIYKHNSRTLVGGRGRDVSFFISSLRNIVNLGMPLVLYTAPEEVDRTQALLLPIFKDKIKIIPHVLEEFKYFERFMAWKEKNIDLNTYINDRNETLCYTKAYWLKDAAEKNYFSTDNFFWIDSGLFHHGIFPEAVGGVELYTNPPDTVYYPHNVKNIFTPTLGEKLEKRIVPGKMFFCSTQMQGCTSRFESFIRKYYNPINSHLGRHLVAGIFGSDKNTVINFADTFDDYLNKILDNEIYTFEEHIYSSMYTVNPNMFTLDNFDTWYFYSPGERTSVLSEEANSFYKIFTNILNS